MARLQRTHGRAATEWLVLALLQEEVATRPPPASMRDQRRYREGFEYAARNPAQDGFSEP